MTQRAEAYIIDAIRTPTGVAGSLAQVHGADLGASVLKRWWLDKIFRKMITTTSSLVCRYGWPLAGDIARTCWLARDSATPFRGRRLTDSVGPLSRQFLAAQAIMSGPWTWSWQAVSRP